MRTQTRHARPSESTTKPRLAKEHKKNNNVMYPKSNTDITTSARPNNRSDISEPRWKKSKTNTEDPIQNILNGKTAELMRAKLLKDKVNPK